MEAQGGDGELIRLLAEDAQTLDTLRSVLQGQILTVKTFANDYCHSYDREGGRKTIHSEIGLYDVEVSQCIRQLEQTVKDLLQFVCLFSVPCELGELTKRRNLHGFRSSRLNAQRVLQLA